MEPLDIDNMSEQELEARIARNQQQADGEPSAGASALKTAGNVVNEVANVGAAVSTGLQQGATNFVGKGVLLLRNVSDTLGFTDEERTKEIQNNLYKMQQEQAQFAESTGYSTVGKVAEVAGEIIPNIAAGVGITAGVKAGLGAAGQASSLLGRLAPAGGRIADVAANAVSGGATSLLASGDKTPAEMARSGLLGTALGGGLSTATNLVGKGVEKLAKGKFVVDDAAAEAFRAAGIQPRPSQIASRELSPKVQTAWEGIENTMNKIPFIGIKNKVRDQAFKARETYKNVIKEMDEGLPDPSPLFETAKQGIDRTKAYALGGVQRSVNDALKNMSANPAYAKNQVVVDYLEQLKGVKNLTFDELHKSRQAVDGMIGTLRKNLTTPASKEDFNALAKIRGQMSDSLEAIARKNGRVKDWKAANQASIDRMAIDEIKAAYTGATKSGGLVFEPKKFNQNLDNALTHLKENVKVPLPPRYETAIKNMKKLSDVMTASQIKPGLPGLSGNLQGIGGMVLGGATGAYLFGDKGTEVGVGATITLGLAGMLTSRAGVNALSGIGSVSAKNPKVRTLLMSAYALGQAKELQDQENQARAMEPPLDIDNMSEQELEARIRFNRGQ